MSRHSWLAVAVAASLSIVGLPWLSPVAAQADSDFAAVMPDANYRSCVTNKLGLAADAEPTTEQLASITELSCTGKGIQDATGTSALTNLTKLFLDDNQLTDVRPLASSTKVFSLGLANNKLTNIAPLAPLTALAAVKLNGNQLRDISVLGTLPAYNALSGTRYGQKATAPGATAGAATVLPSVVSASGKLVTVEAPDDVTVTAGSVTYPSAGSYSWSFRDPDDFYFNGTITVTVTDSAVTIPDANLRSCINTKFGNTDLTVQPTREQLSAATGSLSCKNKGISDLTGLDLMPGLTSVTLTGNTVSDLTPLSALTGLMTLDVAQNDVPSLAPLGSSLTKLGTLRVNQTSASTKTKLPTLVGVDKLTALTSLGVNYSAISNLNPLAGHPTLKTLDAAYNQISDVAPLAAVGLNSLNLEGNRVSDLSPLKGRSYSSKLAVINQVLTASQAIATQEAEPPSVTVQDGSTLIATPPAGTTVADGKVTYAEAGSYAWTFTNAVPPLGATFSGTITQLVKPAPPAVVVVAVPDAGLKSCLNGLLGQDASADVSEAQLAGLTEVSCVGAGITNLTGAEHLTGATKLAFSTNAISDLAPLKGLSGLKELLLPGNAITDPSTLASLTGLETLNLSYNPISSINSLAPLVNLTDLEVTQKSGHTGADLTSLDGVQAMTKLTRLVANNSSLTSLEPVAGLTSLKRLYVSNNKIADLTPVAGLTALTNLGANTNQISDVSALADLTALTDLDLATNKILDLSPLKNLKSLGYLGLKARWQSVTASAVPAQLTVAVPQPRDNTGAVIDVTAPAGVVVANGRLSYANPGSYEWTFTASGEGGEFFSGTITQPVTDPVADAANVPDPGLRSCLAKAAGLGASGIPTEADLAKVTSAACSNAGISELTGAELLTSATSLDLSDNPLDGIKPLAKLDALTSVDLSRTGLQAVDSLAGLKSLTQLKLDGNALRDLSPLGGLTALDSVSAADQKLTLAAVAGGAQVAIPKVTTRSGESVAASVPSSATTSGAGVSFSRAGTYQWPFSVGEFSGSFSLKVTSDVTDDKAHAGASACVNAGRVWVVVERDTGLNQGGCATKFSTGLEALTSAGFAPTGSSMITAIDGYPGATVADSYWSYWHASDPVRTSTGTQFGWTYSQTGAAGYHPEAGSIEGWRFESWKVDPVAPSWTPKLTGTSTSPTVVRGATVRTSYGKSVTIPISIEPSSATGKVTARVGSRLFTATARAGRASIVLPAKLLRPGTHTVALSYAGDGTVAAAQGRATVVVGKAKPKVSVKLKKTVRRGRTATVVVVVTSSTARASGWVTVVLDGRKGTAKLNSKGVATVKVTRVRKSGKRKATVSYAGSKYLSAVKVKKKVTVRR